jgi:hypothetical protein
MTQCISERPSGKRLIVPPLGRWTGTFTVLEQSSNEMTLCQVRMKVTCPLTSSATTPATICQALTLVNAEVRVPSMRGDRR